ncbi:DUF397 domain-containing protein [Streptomyces regalis]|uniref:DUF397 domain-containing protein n=1 Tax=Streptomyces regalis TaxID=68262 RepID=UPI00099E60BD|nr:DUF397 domain-containing protein [Streptomyces regalis]
MSIAESGGHGDLAWSASSYSNGAGGECVEWALANGGILLRDSKNAGGPVVTVESEAWRSFLQTLKHV